MPHALRESGENRPKGPIIIDCVIFFGLPRVWRDAMRRVTQTSEESLDEDGVLVASNFSEDHHNPLYPEILKGIIEFTQ